MKVLLTRLVQDTARLLKYCSCSINVLLLTKVLICFQGTAPTYMTKVLQLKVCFSKYCSLGLKVLLLQGTVMLQRTAQLTYCCMKVLLVFWKYCSFRSKYCCLIKVLLSHYIQRSAPKYCSFVSKYCCSTIKRKVLLCEFECIVISSTYCYVQGTARHCHSKYCFSLQSTSQGTVHSKYCYVLRGVRESRDVIN